ncbi:MAG TPA: polysaccharide deacetylase family protein [Terriglobales bacterium]|nr:polysaccharide deacetylase family protein [Terriglobales bacterium]
MSIPRYLTISVDDGHPTDLRTANLLQSLGLKATFYIPKTNPEREVMGLQDIREIAGHFDMGAHTGSHLSLRSMENSSALAEIEGGKHWLEDLTGRRVSAFCYPRGKFNPRTRDMVEKAGFKGARTCMFNLHEFPKDPFLWGVSTHAFSHSAGIQFRHALLEKNFKGALNFVRHHRCTTDWVEHFRTALDHVAAKGGIAHLYFHSWEIEQQGQWHRLAELLREAAQKEDFVPVTNSELFELWPGF